MYKKLLVATAVLASSMSVALAGAAPYIGGSLGLINNTSKGGGNSYRGVDGNLSVGYGGIVSSKFYLAGEAFVVPGSITVSDSNADMEYSCF